MHEEDRASARRHRDALRRARRATSSTSSRCSDVADPHAGRRAHRSKAIRSGEQRAQRIFEQLQGSDRRGVSRSRNGDVKTAAQLRRRQRRRRSARLLPQGRPEAAEARAAASTRRASTSGKYLDAIEQLRHRLRRRSGGHGQDLSRDGAGRQLPAREEGQPDHPGAARGRSGREAGVPARRSAGEGESVPASALRRALRHDGHREGDAPRRARARSRWRRSPSCAAAR